MEKSLEVLGEVMTVVLWVGFALWVIVGACGLAQLFSRHDKGDTGTTEPRVWRIHVYDEVTWSSQAVDVL